MVAEAAITVQDLHIRYRTLKPVPIRKTLSMLRKSKKDLFHAVRGISFEIPQGKIVGIIGKNGSGKSTLLRAIAGIYSPDEGKIDLHGHTVSLLSIGVGFQANLTGYQNILLSGLLLGFSEKHIRDKMNEIIAFSELGSFIHKPVKTYSSGMYSKLAFSITVILETDILLIDEVLSVGDVAFKEKSYNRMKKLIEDENRTVLIVSHNSKTIRDLCDHVIWVHNGTIRRTGEPEAVIDEYNKFMKVNR
ncbi:MAG: ABC transporter ATP-binding protein [Oscillospiraceae bacterium]|nr:ABC transporter ATP-binding protein [Oscillospiraceae bacterium]